MGIDSTDWDADVDRDTFSVSPSSGVTTGSGGGDMKVWSLERTVRLNSLLFPEYAGNLSAYTLAAAVVDTQGFDNKFEENEDQTISSPSPDSAVHQGSGGGDMRIWSLTRVERLKTLITDDYRYSNQSSYALDKGVVNTKGWDVTFSENEDHEITATEPETDVSAGATESDMRIWNLTRETQLDKLITTDYYKSDKSSYGVPAAITGSGSWDIHFTNGERAVDDSKNPGPEPVDGSGGGTMRIFSLTREKILDALVMPGFHKDFNKSVYPLPGGVVDTNGWDNSFQNGESGLGVSVSGSAKSADGEPMSGQVAMIMDGEVVQSYSVEGNFKVTAPLQPGVYEGASQESFVQYDLVFSPDSSGESYKENDISNGDEFNFSYEALVGYVEDAEGAPVANDTVIVGSTTLNTNQQGRFQIVAPGGTDVEILALDRTVKKNATVGQTGTMTFRYGGVEVSVIDPETGAPIAGAPVVIGENALETGDDGIAYLKTAGIKNYEVSVMGYFDFVADVPSQGYTFTKELGGDSDIDNDFSVGSAWASVTDASSGDPVVGLPVKVPEIGSRSRTGRTGEASILTDNNYDGEITLVIGEGDPRYKTQRYELDPDKLDSFQFETQLERITPTVNI